MTDPEPIAWRLWWLPLLRVPPFHAEPQWQDYTTREDAETSKEDLKRQGGVVACVTPRYTRAYRRRHELASEIEP